MKLNQIIIITLKIDKINKLAMYHMRNGHAMVLWIHILPLVYIINIYNMHLSHSITAAIYTANISFHSTSPLC